MIGSPVRVQCPRVFELCEVQFDETKIREKAEILLRLKVAKIKHKIYQNERRIKLCQEASIEAKIRRQESLLERCELQRKVTMAEWKRSKIESTLKTVREIAAVIEKKREEIQRKKRAAHIESPKERELKREIMTFTKQRLDFAHKYKSRVDKFEHLMYQMKRANIRMKAALGKAQALEKTRDKIVYIQELMMKMKRVRENTRELETKSSCKLENAESVEEKEERLEERILELEDQIDCFKRRTRRVLGILEDYRKGDTASQALLQSIKRSSISA